MASTAPLRARLITALAGLRQADREFGTSATPG